MGASPTALFLSSWPGFPALTSEFGGSIASPGSVAEVWRCWEHNATMQALGARHRSSPYVRALSSGETGGVNSARALACDAAVVVFVVF